MVTASNAPSVDSAEKQKFDEDKPTVDPQPEPAALTKPAPSPPPNGGLTAWLQVAGGFCLFFNTWGVLNAFGVYQTYYESSQLFVASSSDISWIGSLTAFLLLLTGIFAGPVYDRGHLRFLLLVGGFLIVFGQMMLSLSTEYYQVILSQGVVVGIGTGCLFVPCVAIMPQWFSTRLGLAVGVAVSGSAMGGVIYPIVLNKLLPEVGFPWAVRAVAFISLGTVMVPVICMKQRVKPPKVRDMLDVSAFTDIGFMAFVVATFINFIGLFVLFYYLPFYSQANGITDDSLSLYLVSIFNAGSFFGRTVPNIIADKTGPFNILAPASVITGLLMLCMLAVWNVGGIIVIAVVSGFFSGALIGLPPLCLVAITKAENKLPLLGTRMGMAYAMIAFGVLLSGPSAGAILGTGQVLNWTGLWVFAGVTTLVSGLLFAALRVYKYGAKPRVKA